MGRQLERFEFRLGLIVKVLGVVVCFRVALHLLGLRMRIPLLDDVLVALLGLLYGVSGWFMKLVGPYLPF